MIFPNKESRLYLSVSEVPGNRGAKVYNTLCKRYGINAIYLPRRAPSSASKLTEAMRIIEISGCSVSMPLKTAILGELDEVADDAREMQSVNTIINKNGRLVGYNTDHVGITGVLKDYPLKRILIYGAGGVLGAITYALKRLGADEICVYGRNAERVAAKAAMFGIHALSLAEAQEKRSFDLLINAVPSSHTFESSELESLLSCARAAFDLVPADSLTPFLQAADARGMQIFTGLSMFVHQVQKQFQLYFGICPTIDEIIDSLR